MTEFFFWRTVRAVEHEPVAIFRQANNDTDIATITYSRSGLEALVTERWARLHLMQYHDADDLCKCVRDVAALGITSTLAITVAVSNVLEAKQLYAKLTGTTEEAQPTLTIGSMTVVLSVWGLENNNFETGTFLITSPTLTDQLNEITAAEAARQSPRKAVMFHQMKFVLCLEE